LEKENMPTCKDRIIRSEGNQNLLYDTSFIRKSASPNEGRAIPGIEKLGLRLITPLQVPSIGFLIPSTHNRRFHGQKMSHHNDLPPISFFLQAQQIIIAFPNCSPRQWTPARLSSIIQEMVFFAKFMTQDVAARAGTSYPSLVGLSSPSD
jgi:hypothetical protein